MMSEIQQANDLASIFSERGKRFGKDLYRLGAKNQRRLIMTWLADREAAGENPFQVSSASLVKDLTAYLQGGWETATDLAPVRCSIKGCKSHAAAGAGGICKIHSILDNEREWGTETPSQ